MRGKALPRAEDLKQKLIEKYARENEEKLVLSYGLFVHTFFFVIEINPRR